MQFNIHRFFHLSSYRDKHKTKSKWQTEINPSEQKKKKFSKTCISKEIQIIHNTEPHPHSLPTTLVKNGPGYTSALTPVGYPIEVLCWDNLRIGLWGEILFLFKLKPVCPGTGGEGGACMDVPNIHATHIFADYTVLLNVTLRYRYVFNFILFYHTFTIW